MEQDKHRTPERDDQARLRAALSGRYDVIDIVGAGGMATVFRAMDLKHQRQVAIKVLRPELSATLGTDRFLREIEIVAGLQHPRILPLYDSGDADGLLYYVMPLVEGESLRDLIEREQRLPLTEALRIAREVAAALGFAHGRGIVHRDIKPDNVLLNNGEAVVADFGIARAVDVAGSASITGTGVTVGSPAYMSPDQATGQADVDERSDIYSLGCLTFEMIAGQPPYTGDSVQRLAMQHLAAPVPSVREHDPSVPKVIDDAIRRAMAKDPNDRFATASDFADQLLISGVNSAPDLQLWPQPGNRRFVRRATTGLVLTAVVAGGLFLLPRGPTVPTDEALITVLPFRVSGDSSVAFLREGMVDLLTTQLGSLSGARALDSRTILAAWRREVGDGDDPSTEETQQLVARLGSGRMVLGEVVGTSAGLSMNARILEVDGEDVAVASVQGPLDSLNSLVNQLTSQLLAQSAGEPARRLEELTSTSLPAVRAYLAGRAAYRRGELQNAIANFTEALEFDSTFALAALGMASSGAWSQQAGQSAALQRGLRTGYALRDRLSERDRLLFEGYVLPSTGAPHTAAQQVSGWRRAAESAPTSVEAQYEYGDRLYHNGAQVGIDNALVGAEAAFERSLQLDSTFSSPIHHLMEIAAMRGDRARVRTLDALDRALSADAGDYVGWRVALVLEDEDALRDLRSRWDQVGLSALNRIIGFGQAHFDTPADVDSAALELLRRAENGVLLRGVPPGQTLHSWAMNRGRRDLAGRAVSIIANDDIQPPRVSIVQFDADQLPALDAMFWEGDSTAGADAVTRLRAGTTESPAPSSSSVARYYTNLCVVTLWDAIVTENDVTDALSRLRTGIGQDSAVVRGADPTLCVAMIEATVAVAQGAPTTDALIAQLDALLADGPYVFGSDFGGLVLSRLYDRVGNPANAFRVLSRRPYDWDTSPLYLTTYLREEGRIGALLGETEFAMAAYEHYLALRNGADQAYTAHIREVEQAVSQLR